MFDMSCIIRS